MESNYGPILLSYNSYFSAFLSTGIMFFSHNKSANNTFSHDFSAKRMGSMWITNCTILSSIQFEFIRLTMISIFSCRSDIHWEGDLVSVSSIRAWWMCSWRYMSTLPFFASRIEFVYAQIWGFWEHTSSGCSTTTAVGAGCFLTNKIL
jgi:hypothetical protein